MNTCWFDEFRTIYGHADGETDVLQGMLAFLNMLQAFLIHLRIGADDSTNNQVIKSLWLKDIDLKINGDVISDLYR